MLLWTANTCAQLARQWIAFLRALRLSLGFSAPVHGPDYWVLGGIAAVFAAAAFVVAICYVSYRAAWSRRLETVWGGVAFKTDRKNRRAYLDNLIASPGWRSAELTRHSDTREGYCELASAILKSIETDIAARAIATGFVVGLNRNALLDSFTIVASAFELQLHVLTRLGQRPSLRTWMELVKRAGASVFLNTYVGREDALYLNLAIRKAALGVEMGADVAQEASGALADVDWDEILHGVSIPGLSAVTSVATMSMSVGAFGLRHIGMFIEAAANDLLQGVLAAGVLYFHGMALAADCLAVDGEHRASVKMNRTVAESMAVACAPAGRILRDQVRTMRAFLRQRRQLAFAAAKEGAKQGMDKFRDAGMSGWASVKEAGKLFK